MSTLTDNAMLVVRALTRAKKDGLSFYELQQATRLAAEYLPGIIHMLEQQGWLVSALVDGIQPPKRLWHLRKQADRKSTRLNSSHLGTSDAVFRLKKKKQHLQART